MSLQNEILVTIINESHFKNEDITVDIWSRGEVLTDPDVLVQEITLKSEDDRPSISRFISDDLYIVVRKQKNDI